MFNPTEFQQDITKLIFEGNFEKAQKELENPALLQFSTERVRIERLKKLFNEVRSTVENSNLKSEQWERQILKDATELNEEVINIDRNVQDLLSLPAGKDSFSNYSRLRSWFDSDFNKAGEKFKRLLRHSRFHVPIETIDSSNFRVAEDVRICTYAPQLYAYCFNGYYDRTESGRLAKACAINYCLKSEKELDAALLLPIPHLYGNYYHLLSEMVYGIRFAKYLPRDTKIIVGPDKFGILNSILSFLEIEKDRLIHIEKVSDVRIKKAIIPSHPHYFWDNSVYKFFRGIFNFPPRRSGLKLYISRSYSSRSYPNEKAVEDLLIKKGFLILHNEYLSFSQQAYLFSQAEIIISPHGAGETNILFSNDNTKFVELFSSDFLCRDYYLRSRHIGMQYSLMIYEQEINLNDIQNLI